MELLGTPLLRRHGAPPPQERHGAALVGAEVEGSPGGARTDGPFGMGGFRVPAAPVTWRGEGTMVRGSATKVMEHVSKMNRTPWRWGSAPLHYAATLLADAHEVFDVM